MLNTYWITFSVILQATRDVDDPVDVEQARKDAQVLQSIF